MEYKLLIGGEWTGSGDSLDVKNKYDGSTVGVLPTASREDVDRAIEAAERTEELMAEMPAYKRADILLKAAALAFREIVPALLPSEPRRLIHAEGASFESPFWRVAPRPRR